MSCGCDTRIIQIAGGGAGGGPFNVAPNVPAAGQVTVTDTASGNSFVINVTGLIDFSVLTPAQLTALCAAIVANCNVGTSLNLAGNVIQLLDGQGDILDTVDLSALLTPVNIYNTNGALTGNRVVTQGGNDITFVTGGGDFIIDGKLTVTGIIDPTGLQFTGGVQADASIPNGTIYVTNGALSGIPSGEIIFKDFTGNYHRLENQAAAAGSILLADFVQVANRVQDFAGFSQVWNNMAVFTRNNVDGNEVANFTSAFLPTLSNVVTHNAGGSTILAADAGSAALGKLSVGNTVELSYKLGSITSGYSVQLGGVGAALGVPQTHIRTEAIASGTAVVGQVLTLDSVSGEVEFRTPAAGANIYNTNGTLTGNRTVTTGGNFLKFQGGGAFEIGDFTGAAGSRFRITPNFPGGQNSIESTASAVGADIARVGTTDSGAVVGFLNIGGAGQSNFVNTSATGIALNFEAASDLTINGLPGTAGQVLTSQGNNLPPVWAAGGGANIYNTSSNLTGPRIVGFANNTMQFVEMPVSGLQLVPALNGGFGAQVRLFEDPNIGTNFTELKVAASIAANTVFQLPVTNGTAGQVLQTDGSGVTSWETPTSTPSPGRYLNAGSLVNLTDVQPSGTIAVVGTPNWNIVTNSVDFTGWPGFSNAIALGTGITFNAGTNLCTLSSSPFSRKYRIDLEFTLSHSVASANVWALLMSSLPQLQARTAVFCVNPANPTSLRLSVVVQPGAVGTNFFVRFGSNVSGDVRIHSYYAIVQQVE